MDTRWLLIVLNAEIEEAEPVDVKVLVFSVLNLYMYFFQKLFYD